MKYFILFLVESIMTACSNDDDSNLQSIKFTSWKLKSYTMVDNIAIPSVDSNDKWGGYTLRFSDSGFGGRSIIDSYSGECTFSDNGDISILTLFHTQAGSTEYFLYLSKVKTYKIKRDKLYLYLGDSGKYLLFDKTE